MSNEASSVSQPGNYVVLGESTDSVIDGIRHRLVYCAAPPERERPDAAKDRRMWLVKEAAALRPWRAKDEASVENVAAEVIALAQELADWVEEA